MTEAVKGRAAEGVPPVLDILPRPCYNTRMKTLNIGIFAHIDAGKTTLSERILLEGGVLRREGSVDSGTAATDFLAIERARGISVRDATVTFAYNGTAIDLIDTPGHAASPHATAWKRRPSSFCPCSKRAACPLPSS